MSQGPSRTKTLTFSLLSGTTGPDVVDTRNLYSQHNIFAYDPSFTSTASCKSALTFIDGEAGQLWHRGYHIKELAENSTYLELSYLLFHGSLPQHHEFDAFKKDITTHTLLHEQVVNFFRGFPRNAHPMAILLGVVGALSAFYHDGLDVHDPDKRMTAGIKLLAKVPTIAAMAYRYQRGFPFMHAQNNLSYAGNLLHMMFAMPTETYQVNPIVEKAVDQMLILHADHEQNASTSTVRMVGSSAANPFACITAGIASLWGVSHGGANEAVINMLHEIQTKDRIPLYIEKAKNKKDPFRLMGFGHRVYKSHDPRASVLRHSCHKVLESLGVLKDEPLFELAIELEQLALADEYFIQKKLFPNVDFYSGIILKALGLPTSMFTVFFAIARTAGWFAQWKEMMEDPTSRISRPRQMYVGEKLRPYKPMDQR